MTAFNFTTGNTDHLVGGGGASMGDIQGSFVDLKTFLNAGTIDETNVPNLAAAFTHYRDVLWAVAALPAGTVSGPGTWLLWAGAPGNAGTQNTPGQAGAASSASASFILDPTDYQANARVTKYRLRVRCLTNAVAAGCSFTAGLYPVTAFGGGSGANPIVGTLGTVVTGSQPTAFTTPLGSTNTVQVGTDFNAPSAGNYVIAVTSTAIMNANAVALFSAQLQMRQV